MRLNQRTGYELIGGWIAKTLWLAVALAGAPVAAQQPASITPDELLEREQQAFRAAANAAQDTAVQIESFGGMERVGEELVSDGPTTGTIVGEDGWIISSLYSFRQQPASILVRLPDGRRMAARIVARDYSRELVLLKVEGVRGLPVAQPSRLLDQPDALVGRWAIALGKAYDARIASQSVGIVSAVGRAYGRALQTDAKVSPINYGGPLVDIHGQVLGVLAPITPGPFIEGGGAQLYDSGIGFAIPLTDILARLPRMQKGQDIYPGKLGVVTTDQNEMAGPVVVAGAMPGAAAGKAGVRAGDVIVAAGGIPVRRLADLKQALGPVDADQPFSFRVWRNGEYLDLQTVLTAEIPVYRRRLVGVWLQPEPQRGLRVMAVEPGSPAAQAGLRAGDVIVGCNDTSPISVEQLRSMMAVAELDQPLVFEVKRGDEDSPAQIQVRPIERPHEMPQGTPPPRPAGSAQPKVVDINLGDFPNKAFAVIPGNIGNLPLGVLIVFPEPGELSQDATLEFWSETVNNYGWIVAVINSGNPNAWSLEELELASRTLGHLKKQYPVDPDRVVFGGIGIGGRAALLAAMAARDRVVGVLLIGTQLGGFKPRQASMPMNTLDFLLVGDAAANKTAIEQLRGAGYGVVAIDGVGTEKLSWQTAPADQVQIWLEGLARF